MSSSHSCRCIVLYRTSDRTQKTCALSTACTAYLIHIQPWPQILPACILQVYVVNPNKTDVLLLIGAIYYQLGNYEQCIAFNDRCILLDPHMAEAHANLANALQQLGNFDMAVIYYQVTQAPVTSFMLLSRVSHTCAASSCSNS